MPETSPQSAPEMGGPPEKESRPAGNGATESGAGAEALNRPQSNANENGSQQEMRASSGTAAAKPVTSPQKKLSSAVPAFERKVLTDQPVTRYSAMATAAAIEADVEQRAAQAWQQGDFGFTTPAERAQELKRLKKKAVDAHNTGAPPSQRSLLPTGGRLPQLRHFTEVTQRMLDEGRASLNKGAKQVMGGAFDPVLPERWSAEMRIAWATADFLLDYCPAEYDNRLAVSAELIKRTRAALVKRRFVPDDKSKKTVEELAEGVDASAKGRLVSGQLAELMFWHARIKRISLVGIDKNGGDADNDVLAVYAEDGDARGTYVEDDSTLRALARSFSPVMSQQVANSLFGTSSTSRGDIWNAAGGNHRVERTLGRGRWVACANGVFDAESKALRDFDAEHDVFMSKLSTDCPLSEPEEPVRILSDGTEWTFSSWLLDLFAPELPDAEDVVEFMWQVIAAVLRPGLALGKMILPYSEHGNSGKGTFVELLMNLLGEGSSSYASIPLDEWGGEGSEFRLEQLMRATAILTDENDVGEYLPKLGRLKSAITGDRLTINRKHKPVVKTRFLGTVVQCMNAVLKTRDKTDSFYRRLIWVLFPKNFEGKEFKEIKQLFLKDPEVLSWVVWKALHTPFGGAPDSPEYDVPMSCRTLLEEVKVDNDTVRQFWEEYADKFVWDVLPNSFLYGAFRGSEYYGQNNLGSREFSKRLKSIVQEEAKRGGHWDAPKDPVRVGKRMDEPEPLIQMLDLRPWMNTGARGSSDWRKVCSPVPPDTARGLVRIVPRTASVVGPPVDDEDVAPVRETSVDDLDALAARGFNIVDSTDDAADAAAERS